MLGLEINSHSVNGARLEGSRVLSYGNRRLDDESLLDNVVSEPHAVAAAIQALTRSLRVKSERVCLSVGGAQVVNKWVDLPRVSQEELSQAAPFEAPRHLPPATEPMVYRMTLARDAADYREDQVTARLIAIPESVLFSRLQAIALAGFEPVLVLPEADLTACVFTRLHPKNSLLWHGKASAILNIRQEYTEMSITREQDLEFSRTLPAGLEEVQKAIENELSAGKEETDILMNTGQIDSEGALCFEPEMGLPAVDLRPFLQELTSEMRRLLDFQRSRFPEGSYLGLLDTFLITGEGACLRGLDRYCSRALGVTCAYANPLSDLEWGPRVQPLEPVAFNTYTAVLGAAMYPALHPKLTLRSSAREQVQRLLRFREGQAA